MKSFWYFHTMIKTRLISLKILIKNKNSWQNNFFQVGHLYQISIFYSIQNEKKLFYCKSLALENSNGNFFIEVFEHEYVSIFL